MQREKPWTPREHSLYTDVKRALTEKAVAEERLRVARREISGLRKAVCKAAK